MARITPEQYSKLTPRLRASVTEFVAAKYFNKNKTSSPVSVLIKELKERDFEGLGRYRANNYVRMKEEYRHKTVSGVLSDISADSSELYLFIAQQMDTGVITVHDKMLSK